MKKAIALSALVVLALAGCSYNEAQALNTPNSVIQTSADFWSGKKTFGYVNHEGDIIDLPVCGVDFFGPRHCETESGSVYFQWSATKGGGMTSAFIEVNGERTDLTCRLNEESTELRICLPNGTAD